MTSQRVIKKIINLDDGRKIEIETGKLAKQADGSVVVKMGNTMILATVVSEKEAKEGTDFLPLTVEYKEKFASSGRFPGGFIKRESRPTDEEILISRLVDRVIRPMFPKDYHSNTQVVIQLISYDVDARPDSLAGLATSACLSISDIPFEPISEVRVSRIEGKLKINPTLDEINNSDLDIIVGASSDSVVMVEGEMKEISEQEMLEAIKFAHRAIKEQIRVINELSTEVGNIKREYNHEKEDIEELQKFVVENAVPKIKDIINLGLGKSERTTKINEIFDDILEKVSQEDRDENIDLLKKYFDEQTKDIVRKMILNEGVRLDKRKTDEIRHIWSEVNYLPSTHGSALFTRGETQSLTTVTLGSKSDVNVVDGISNQYREKFYLHYNFPSFSTGEAKPMRGVSRREIGHGNLAFRALKSVIPEDTPYTVRVVSDILESNGSSSMATVCAGTLALMDAGIQIKKPVSGIAMGLISEGNKWSVLSDILGDEDHLGDMDFKVTGTRDGITACQMDIKIKGLTYEILEKALMQANKGRIHILEKMLETIPEPRENVKENAPKIVEIKIPAKFIGSIIGPGGKIIQKLQEITETTIVIEEDGKYGIVQVLGKNSEYLQKAINKIKEISFEPVIGETYKSVVKSILDFGAVVEINKGTEALLHVSEMSWNKVQNVNDELKVGDEIEIKVLGIDPKNNKLKISRKVLLEKNIN